MIAILASLWAFSAVTVYAKLVPPPELLYERGIDAYQREDWLFASRRLTAALKLCPSEDPLRRDIALYLGIAQYHRFEYEEANAAFNIYLQQRRSAEHFLTVLEYKFAIAEALRCGEGTRIYSSRYLPRWGSGSIIALEIYDDIAMAAPSHPLASRALYAKGALLAQLQSFSEAVSTYQMFLRRFPRHELAPSCYRLILEVYVQQAYAERYNLDLLPLAEVVIERWRVHFPRDSQFSVAEWAVAQISEIYAGNLYIMGCFYERLKAPSAAAVCYMGAVRKYPVTSTANVCRERLLALEEFIPPGLSNESDAA